MKKRSAYRFESRVREDWAEEVDGVAKRTVLKDQERRNLQSLLQEDEDRLDDEIEMRDLCPEPDSEYCSSTSQYPEFNEDWSA